MINYIVGRNLGHLNRCVSTLSKWDVKKRESFRIFAYPESQNWLKKNLPKWKMCNFSRNIVKKNVNDLLDAKLIIHDWREEVELLKKNRKDQDCIIAGIYHSQLSSFQNESETAKKFRHQIIEMADKTTDIFFHINLLKPQKRPKLTTYYVPIPLIARKPTKKPKTIRRKLGLKEKEPFILVQMGGGTGSYSYKYIDEWYKKINKLDIPFKIVIAGGLEEKHFSFRKGIIRAPLFSNGADLVNAASLVISKPGMGILTDCIVTRTPLISLPADSKERELKNLMLKKLVKKKDCLVPREISIKKLEKKIMRVYADRKHYKEAFRKVPIHGAEIMKESIKLLHNGSKKDLPQIYKKILKLTPYHK